MKTVHNHPSFETEGPKPGELGFAVFWNGAWFKHSAVSTAQFRTLALKYFAERGNPVPRKEQDSLNPDLFWSVRNRWWVWLKDHTISTLPRMPCHPA